MSDAVERALDSLRPGLAVDGFDLRLESIDHDGRVHIVLDATPQACADCLVPEPTMVAILEAAIRDEDPRLGPVTLTMPPVHPDGSL
jgi:Fe-S cluster biogenesis protein NfuA